MLASNLRQGAVYLLIGEALLAIMGAMIKFLSESLTTEQIVFFRNLAALVILIPLILNQGKKLLYTQQWRWHLMRGVVGVSAMFCYFWALAHMPLTEAFLVKLSSPLFMPIIGFLWLRESISRFSLLALMIGFFGVILILRPDHHGFDHVALIAVLGAVLAALAKVTIRRMSGTESSQTIVFYFAVIATLISTPGAVWAWQPVAPNLWVWLGLLGLVATLGQLALTHAYRIAPTGKVGVYAYSAVLYGAFMGWVFWNEIPQWSTWLGAVFILAAGLLNLKSRTSKAIPEAS